MAELKRSEDQMKEWLGLLDDKERADVLKVQIAEEAKTERVRIEQDADTQRNLIATEGYHVVRGLAVAAAFCAVIGVLITTCEVSKSKHAVDTARIEAEHPRPAPLTPPVQPSAQPR